MTRCLLILSIVICFVSCNEQSKKNEENAEAGKIVITNSYAQHFSIEQKKNYKQLRVLYPDGGEQIYILYHEVVPDVKTEKAVFIKTPVTSVSCLSSLYVGFMSRLSQEHTIDAVDNADYIANEIVKEGIAAGSIKELAKMGDLNEEIAITLHPDVIFTYGVGTSDHETNKKVKASGIPVVYCVDNRENSALGRAEWIRFIACFFDAEELADSLFRETEKRYLQYCDSAATTSLKPTVLTEVKLSDAWYVPGGKSYMAGMIKDANALYCWKDSNTEKSLPLSFEEVYKKGVNADYWINLGFCHNKAEVLRLDKRYAEFNAYKTGNIYNYNARETPAGGNELWETGIINPDLVLRDLIKIFHPEMYADKPFIYYQKLNE